MWRMRLGGMRAGEGVRRIGLSKITKKKKDNMITKNGVPKAQV